MQVITEDAVLLALHEVRAAVKDDAGKKKPHVHIFTQGGPIFVCPL